MTPARNAPRPPASQKWLEALRKIATGQELVWLPLDAKEAQTIAREVLLDTGESWPP